MPRFSQHLMHKPVLWLVAASVILIALLVSGVLPPWHVSEVRRAFDDTLLADEPLQIGDVRINLTAADIAARRSNWSMALRLIRDARNQWEAFVPLMHSTYESYKWSQGDINQATQIWVDAIQQAEYRNLSGVRRALINLESIMNRYRLPLTS